MIERFVSFDEPLPTTRGLSVSAILLTSAPEPALAIGWDTEPVTALAIRGRQGLSLKTAS